MAFWEKFIFFRELTEKNISNGIISYQNHNESVFLLEKSQKYFS